MARKKSTSHNRAESLIQVATMAIENRDDPEAVYMVSPLQLSVLQRVHDEIEKRDRSGIARVNRVLRRRILDIGKFSSFSAYLSFVEQFLMQRYRLSLDTVYSDPKVRAAFSIIKPDDQESVRR